mgnify:CR=1 FL=1|jgi:hypothetical protein
MASIISTLNFLKTPKEKNTLPKPKNQGVAVFLYDIVIATGATSGAVLGKRCHLLKNSATKGFTLGLLTTTVACIYFDKRRS